MLLLYILMSGLYLEYPLEYKHDTSQLFRTGHDDVLYTRMTILAFILSELFSLDGFRCDFIIRSHNLNTLLYIIMIIYSYVEQVLTMCRIPE